MENNNELNESQDLKTPQDTLTSSLILARALSLILQENQGIVVDLLNNLDLGDDTSKVIVFKFQEQIHIYKCEEDLAEGTAVMMGEPPMDSE